MQRPTSSLLHFQERTESEWELLVKNQIEGLQQTLAAQQNQPTLELLCSFLDLTSLEATDNESSIKKLCEKALLLNMSSPNLPAPGALCLYGPLIPVAKQALAGNAIKIAAVSCAFPSGMAPLSVKLEETRHYLQLGADEIDMVISRGAFLAGQLQVVSDEIAQLKKLCGTKTLKVILETGELKTLSNIALASQIALEAGADFIKTSTGKISIGATTESALVMLTCIKEYFDSSGRKAGFKASGGVSDSAKALLYMQAVELVLGSDWLKPSLFRIGASRLADELLSKIMEDANTVA